MSFGFGPGSEMQKDYNRNSSLLKKRKSLKNLHEIYKMKATASCYLDNEIVVKDITELKQRLEKERRSSDRKQIVLLVILVLCVLTILFFNLN